MANLFQSGQDAGYTKEQRVSEFKKELRAQLGPLRVVQALRPRGLEHELALHERQARQQPLRHLVHHHASEGGGVPAMSTQFRMISKGGVGQGARLLQCFYTRGRARQCVELCK